MPLAWRRRLSPRTPKAPRSTSGSAWARSPTVWMPRASRVRTALGPTPKRFPTGMGQSFCGTSSGQRVWVRLGFSKSEAVLASSRFTDTPTLTVKPSSRNTRSRRASAASTGGPKSPSLPVISTKASSMLNCSTTGE